MIERHKQYNDTLQALIDHFDATYPNWRENKIDYKYILDGLKATAKKMCENKLKRKLRHIKRSDFKDWPFKSDSIILVQTSKLWVSCIVKCHEYALNGLAQTGLNIPFAHDKGIAIKGKSVGEFIQMGLGL